MNCRVAWTVGASALLALVATLALRPSPLGRPGGAHDEASKEAGRPTARVSISSDGAVSLSLADAPSRPIGTIGSEDAPTQRATLDRLGAALRTWGEGAAKAADARPPSTLDLTVAPSIVWERALWVLEVAAAPPVGIRRVGLVRADLPGVVVARALDEEEPSEDGVGRDEADPPEFRVRLDTEEVAVPASGRRPTRVSLAILRPDAMLQWLPSEARPEWHTCWATYDGVRRLAKEVRGGDASVTGGMLDVPRPERLRLPFGDVFTVLRALDDEGVVAVRILHPATTLPGDR